MVVLTSAPANIAVIKYMGKTDPVQNKPTNSSLSLTLDELRTIVRISLPDNAALDQDQWRALPVGGMQLEDGFNTEILPLSMSQNSIDRFLAHFKKLKTKWGISKNFLVESGSNFPSDCGLASSASSFAALTKASVQMFQQLAPKDDVGLAEIAELSRLGSGSSCRSFFGPWALWYSSGVRPMEFPIQNVFHQVIVVESAKKEVSSSQAHLRVSTSTLFHGRPERAERRLAELIQAFEQQNWRAAYDICWAEFWDMHALFETSKPAFGYITEGTQQVLTHAKNVWAKHNDGPLVTMDAGANVHFIWRADQEAMAIAAATDLGKKFRVWSSRDSAGNQGHLT